MARTYRPGRGQIWEDRYAYNTVSENADGTEWSAVINEKAHLSIGITDEMMAEAGEEFVPVRTRDDRLQGREVVQEALQGSVSELILERKKILGDAYPFEIDGNTLCYQPGTSKIYEALLGMCKAPSLSQAPYNQLAQLFENISVLAGRGYFGATAKGYRSGWPRPEGELNRVKAMIEGIKFATGNYIGEWFWRPNEQLPDDPTSRNMKEGGLDVVVWRPWEDRRTGQLYLLGQCACGEDWIDKFKDLDVQRLKDNWASLCYVEPVRGFFTPRYVVNPMLAEASQEGGLVFDRVRIVQALLSHPCAEEVEALADEFDASIEIAKTPIPPANNVASPAVAVSVA